MKMLITAVAVLGVTFGLPAIAVSASTSGAAPVALPPTTGPGSHCLAIDPTAPYVTPDPGFDPSTASAAEDNAHHFPPAPVGADASKVTSDGSTSYQAWQRMAKGYTDGTLVQCATPTAAQEPSWVTDPASVTTTDAASRFHHAPHGRPNPGGGAANPAMTYGSANGYWTGYSLTDPNGTYPYQVYDGFNIQPLSGANGHVVGSYVALNLGDASGHPIFAAGWLAVTGFGGCMGHQQSNKANSVDADGTWTCTMTTSNYDWTTSESYVAGASPWDDYAWTYDANCGTSGCANTFHSTSHVLLDGHVIWMTSRQCTNPSGLIGCSSWATLANHTPIWNDTPEFWDTAQSGSFSLAAEVISGAHFVWTLPYTTTDGTSSGTTVQTALDPENDGGGHGFWTCATSDNNADRISC